jgi:hypothetical protein
MMSLLGLLILLLVIIAGGAVFGLVGNWYLTLPLGALSAVMIAAVWFNAGKRS